MLWVLAFALTFGGVGALFKSLEIAGIEAPQPTRASNALGYGGMAAVAAGLLLVVYDVVRLFV